MRSLSGYFKVFWRLRKSLAAADLIRVAFFRLGYVALHRFGGKVVHVRPKGTPYRVAMRIGGSDFTVFSQIFVGEEYRVVTDLAHVRTVIDCGANVGYATLYFAWKLGARAVVAVEPDPANFAVCRANLEQLGEGVRVVQAGVWSRPVGLVVERGVYRDGADQSVVVRPAVDGEAPAVQAVSVPELIRQLGIGTVDLLKIDIEGSEREVFSGDTSWLRGVKNLIVELHDDACAQAFRRAMAGFEFEEARTVDAVLCRNIRPRAVAGPAGSGVTG